MKNLLTIVIPCKNEEAYIGKCLNSLSIQKDIDSVKIIIADANSTDRTIEIIDLYRETLDIIIIEGGLPAIGRNRGAQLANSKYILFIDSDCEIYDDQMLSQSILKMEMEELDLLASKLNSNHLVVKFLYKINNFVMWLSKFDKPFAVGMYFMIRRDVFNQLGGFPEDVMHCEDYLLSQKVDKKKFGIINKDVYSDNRRFEKMGYWGMTKYIFKNIVNRNNYDYFKKDINYWTIK